MALISGSFFFSGCATLVGERDETTPPSSSPNAKVVTMEECDAEDDAAPNGSVVQANDSSKG